MRLLILAGLLACGGLAAQGQSLRVMTYNIRYDNAGDGINAWPQRKAELANQVRYYGPMVLGIQEGLHHQVAYLDSALADYSYVGGGRDDGRQGGEYSALFYATAAWELLEEGQFWLSPTPDRPSQGWDAALPRIATWAKLRYAETGETWAIINTHFDHQGEQARLESAKMLRAFANGMESQGYKVVLMGDLNATPEQEPIRELRRGLADTESLTANPAFGPGGTFGGWNAGEPVARRIDYVWVGGGIAVLKYGVLSDSRDGRYYSDHLPVLVELQ